MGSMVALSLKTIKKKGDTHDTGKRGGIAPPPLSDGNCENSLPNSHANRTDFSDCKTLLTQKACQRPKSPYKSRTCGRQNWIPWKKECVTCEYYHLTNRARYGIMVSLNRGSQNDITRTFNLHHHSHRFSLRVCRHHFLHFIGENYDF